MSKSMRNHILSALLLISVAGVSYAAGAAKAKKAGVITPISELVWEDLMPGGPLKYAKLWGDRSKGEYGMLLKLPAGFEAGMHAHTLDYYAVNTQGTWVHTVEGDTGPAKELPPGSYVMQPGKQFHNDVCKGKVDCLLFIHQHGKGDFILAKSPDDKPPAAKK